MGRIQHHPGRKVKRIPPNSEKSFRNIRKLYWTKFGSFIPEDSEVSLVLRLRRGRIFVRPPDETMTAGRCRRFGILSSSAGRASPSVPSASKQRRHVERQMQDAIAIHDACERFACGRILLWQTQTPQTFREIRRSRAALSAKRLRCLRSTPLTGCGRPAFSSSRHPVVSSSLAVFRNRYSGIPTFTWKKRLEVFVGPREFVSSALPSTV